MSAAGKIPAVGSDPESGSRALFGLSSSVTMTQITTVDEAKQFYPLFGLGANVALIFSGRAVKYFSQVS